MQNFDLLILDIAEVITASAKYSDHNNKLGRIKNAAIGVKDGLIAFVGEQSKLDDEDIKNAASIYSAKGAVIFPGLIDSHTHLVFGGSREKEFAKRISGMSYMQIAKEGGGINATVRATRQASESELFERGYAWLDDMLSNGVTTIEAKSGYGLNTETELKQLSVIGKLNSTHPSDVVATFLGSHEFPPEYKDDHEAYVDLIINEMLPAVKEQGIAKFCDVFCEKGVFDVQQSRRILLEAKKFLSIRLHADEFEDSNAASLAAELSAVSADHLMAVSENGIKDMVSKGVIATLLPGTSYYLGAGKYANARALIEAGLKVVLASDFNPGSAMISSLPFVANIAMTQMKMNFDECILAITRYAADALLWGDRLGSLETGMQADLFVADIPNPEYFLYHQGRKHCHKVLKKGVWVYTNPQDTVFLK